MTHNIAAETGFSRSMRIIREYAGEREVVLALAFALPLGALVLGLFRGGRKDGRDEPRQQRERAMSFTSGFMSSGSWPEDTGMCDPIITACLFVDEAPSREALEAASAKILRFHNFRALPCRQPWTLFPPAFSVRYAWRDIEVHPADVLTRVEVKGSAEVLAEMDRIKDASLRTRTEDGRELPVWGIHLIENTGKVEAGIGSVAVLRVHHTIGDGLSLVAVSRSVLESASTGGKIGIVGAEKEGLEAVSANSIIGSSSGRRPANGSSRLTVGQILRAVGDVISTATGGPDTPLPFGHFEGPFSRGGSPAAAPKGWSGRGAFSGRRRSILLPDIPLSLIKKIKNASGTSVNDVIMSLVAGCIRRYSEANGAGSSIGGRGFKSRALIPVALPSMPRPVKSDDSAPGVVICNKWAFVSMNLSVDEANPGERVRRIKATMADVKNRITAGLQYLTQSYLMPRLPLWICREIVYNMLATHTVTVSNVPGPQEPITFASVRLRRNHFVFSNLMPEVGVVSLDGIVAINFVVDPLSVPDSHTLPAHFLSELEALARDLGVDASEEISGVRADMDALVRVMEEAVRRGADGSIGVTCARPSWQWKTESDGREH